MEHHFNTTIAKSYGIEEAVLLHHFYFWIVKNAANKKHFHEGLYWTYNSKKAYADFFTYMNETKIFRIIKHLEEEGIIVKGNFNEDKWDKTNWYALTVKGLKMMRDCGYDIAPFSISLQNDLFDCVKMNDGACQNERCNTDIITDNNNKENEIDKSISKSSDELFETCWIAYRRKGKKGKAYPYWKKLTDDEKQSVLPHIKAYVQAKELQYQQDFERYLRDKTFQSIVISRNTVVYDPARSQSNEYRPTCDVTLMWNDYYKAFIYIGYWDGHIPDGYTDENRPDGATVMLNNGRGNVKWSKEKKQWIKE
jgi:hypothetical protein